LRLLRNALCGTAWLLWRGILTVARINDVIVFNDISGVAALHLDLVQVGKGTYKSGDGFC